MLSTKRQGDIESKYLIDAYCGSGLFGLSGASYFQKVTGVEISQKAFLGAQANAKLNMITNAEFILGDASSIFEYLDHALRPCSLIIDPRGKDVTPGSSTKHLALHLIILFMYLVTHQLRQGMPKHCVWVVTESRMFNLLIFFHIPATLKM